MILDDALRAVLAVQQLIEAEFQAFLALVVDGGEADDMPGDLARGVVAPILAQQVHAGDPQGLDMRRLLRAACAAPGTEIRGPDCW